MKNDSDMMKLYKKYQKRTNIVVLFIDIAINDL